MDRSAIDDTSLIKITEEVELKESIPQYLSLYNSIFASLEELPERRRKKEEAAKRKEREAKGKEEQEKEEREEAERKEKEKEEREEAKEKYGREEEWRERLEKKGVIYAAKVDALPVSFALVYQRDDPSLAKELLAHLSSSSGFFSFLFFSFLILSYLILSLKIF